MRRRIQRANLIHVRVMERTNRELEYGLVGVLRGADGTPSATKQGRVLKAGTDRRDPNMQPSANLVLYEFPRAAAVCGTELIGMEHFCE